MYLSLCEDSNALGSSSGDSSRVVSRRVLLRRTIRSRPVMSELPSAMRSENDGEGTKDEERKRENDHVSDSEAGKEIGKVPLLATRIDQTYELRT